MLKSALRHFPLVLVIVVSFAFIGFALAEEADVSASAEVNTSVTATPPAVKPIDAVRARLNQVKQAAVDAKVQLKTNTKVEVQNDQAPPQNRAGNSGTIRLRALVLQHAGLVKARLVLAQKQFDSLIVRIESRVAKMKAEGKATATIEADLAVAKSADVTAKADVQAVTSFIATVNDSSDRAATKAQLEALVKKAQVSIKATHDALAKVIRGLVGNAADKKIKADASASGGATVDTTNE
jgi:hypothetical protein